MTVDHQPPTPSIVSQRRALLDSLPLSDTRDFDNATRGLIARREPNAVTADDGTVLWDNDTYAFLDGHAPDSVNPSLWRQSKLNSIQGLFEVVPGIYQVRGVDLSNTTFVEGDEGVVVIDTLLSVETGTAALELYRDHRGDRPVKAVIYTHSHADHFGGVKGFVSQDDVDSGDVRIFAPEGFVEHAASENVYAGTAMNRRAGYMYGAALARGPRGQVGAGLGQTLSTGTVTLIPPTDEITTTGHEETVDRPVRREGRGRLRLAPLADVGLGQRGRVPVHPARSVRLRARPDAPAAQQGAHRSGDRRGDHPPAGAGERVERPRLLRFGQPQRQGDLPALPRLVRRQPGEPVAAHAGGTGKAVRRPRRRRGRHRHEGAGVVRRRRLPLDGRDSQPRGLRPAGSRGGQRAAGEHLRATRLRRRERHLAELVSLRRHRAARRPVRHANGALPALAMGGLTPDKLAAAGIEVSGDASALSRLVALLDPGDKDFAIVTP